MNSNIVVAVKSMQALGIYIKKKKGYNIQRTSVFNYLVDAGRNGHREEENEQGFACGISLGNEQVSFIILQKV